MQNKTIEQLEAEIESGKAALNSTGVTQSAWAANETIILGLAILVFGLAIVVMMAILLAKDKPADVVLRTFSIPIILVFAVFLMIVGWTERQVAPVMGLFGTIAGYLLGKTDRPPSNERGNRPSNV